MAEPDIDVTIDTQDPPIGTSWNPDPALDFSVDPQAAPIGTSWNPDPALDFSILLSDASGPPGPRGPAGARGSIFLGAYPTFSNLPAIDGVGVAVGDYALVTDTSTMYQVR